VSPAVSPTNLVFNVVAIPSGMYRFIKEGRMAWPLTWVVVVGTLPGVAIGAFVRIRYLPDPKAFKVFAGLVLLYIGLRMVRDLFGGGGDKAKAAKDAEKKFQERWRSAKASEGERDKVRTLAFTASRITYSFYGETFSFSTWGIMALSFAVGIIGGVYGIGGGAIVAPFFVAVFRLPVYTIAGAALAGTFITSIFGVIFYQFVVPGFAPPQLTVAPDWALGFLFGLGGLVGIYLGARAQKYVPAKAIKIILSAVLLYTALQYVASYWGK
jgi:uncharacterized membrane protein YfcA